jgi:Flp pilus assembly protein TadD
MMRTLRSARVRATSAALLLPLLGLGACAGPGPRDPALPAETYLDAGRLGEAAREIELAVRAHPEDPELRQTAARINAKAGYLDRAVGHLEAALEKAPRDPETSILLGEIEQRRDKPGEAYVAFRRAAQLAPDDPRAVGGLALTAEALGFDKEARDAYATWADIDAAAAAEHRKPEPEYEGE